MTPQALTAASRQALLQQVVTGVNATNPKYSRVAKSGINPQTILYFGDPLLAEFATFGVIPSATELTWERWPKATLTVEELDARLVDYFTNPIVPAHSWFDGYERPLSVTGPDKALNILGHSYRSDTVHLDLSPRATLSPSSTKKMSKDDRKLFLQEFLQMIAADMQWFLSALALCRNLKGAIMSGSVTGQYYFDEFL